MQYFETKFENRSGGTQDVLEDGKTLVLLQPGDKKMVESQDPSTSYAAYSRITYEKDGTVTLHENRDWRFPLPEGMLMLEIFNRDGSPAETFYPSPGGTAQPIIAYKGIPRFCCVDIHNAQWASVARLEIKLVEHTEHQGDLVVRKKVLEHVRTPRSKSEIKAIEKRLLAEYEQKAKDEMKRLFPRPGQ